MPREGTTADPVLALTLATAFCDLDTRPRPSAQPDRAAVAVLSTPRPDLPFPHLSVFFRLANCFRCATDPCERSRAHSAPTDTPPTPEERRRREMAFAQPFPMNRRGCFVCGKPGHIAAACTSTERLCFNCGEPGHESNACPNPKVSDNKQCYSCGGMGHLAADCPSIRVAATLSAAGPKCYNCQQFGHIARSCPNATVEAGAGVGVDGVAPVAPVPVAARPLGARVGGFAPRGGFRGGFMGARGGFMGAQAGGRGRCYGCGGFGHVVATCPTAAAFGAPRGPKTCYKCQQEGHIARDCPLNAVPAETATIA
ncbi:hypothetical protein NBRC10512_003545 [Rhodotorula toruloides]